MPSSINQEDDLLEIKALGKEGSYDAIRDFASKLTTRARELEKNEREFLITPPQVTSILQEIIESFLYAAIQVSLKRESARHDCLPKSAVLEAIGEEEPIYMPVGIDTHKAAQRTVGRNQLRETILEKLGLTGEDHEQ